ncbi:MAG: hypothetical protein PHD15_04660 [Clostridia bacterium]|nr:hypothetical protein [Clostridia bacterium]MDD4387031.1 hypothetical protein [Clostridia bacterium]
MSSFNDYCETIKYNNEILAIYFKMNIEANSYYICENYRVFKNENNDYVEVKDKKILQIIRDMVICKKHEGLYGK